MTRSVLAAGLIALSTLFAATSADAQAIPCGEGYTVGDGDSLARIAVRAYGSQAAVDLLFNFNRRRIGDNPSLIQPGLELAIPCLDTPDDPPQETAPVVFAEGQVVDIAFLTGTDFAPFSDQGYPRGGMSTAIVEEAARLGMPDDAHRIYFVNDWSAHLDTLLIDRLAFDAAFPWFRPNCESDKLDDNSRLRCDGFYWSDPLYENVVPFYALSSSGFDPRSPEDLVGKKICRAAGYFTFDLVEYGLLGVGDEPDSIEFVQAASPIDCFRELVAGRVDFVTHNALTAQGPISELGIGAEVETHDRIASINTLHVIVPRNRPEGRVLIERINRGLRQMEASGRLDELKREFLEIFLKSVAPN